MNKIGNYEIKRVTKDNIEYIRFVDFNIYCQIFKTHLTGYKEDNVEVISIPNFLQKDIKNRTKKSIPIYYNSVDKSLTSFTSIYNGIEAYDFKDYCADAITLFLDGVVDFFYYNQYDLESTNLNNYIEITAAFKVITIDEDYRKFENSKFARYYNLISDWMKNEYIKYYLGFYTTDYLGEKLPYYFYERHKAIPVTSLNAGRVFTDNTYCIPFNAYNRERTERHFLEYSLFPSIFDAKEYKDLDYPNFRSCMTLISKKEVKPELFSKIVIPFDSTKSIDYSKRAKTTNNQNNVCIVNLPII